APRCRLRLGTRTPSAALRALARHDHPPSGATAARLNCWPQVALPPHSGGMSLRSLPALGLGTWQTFDVDPSAHERCEAVTREFLDLGGRVIDTSPMYGKAEATIGAVRERLGHGVPLVLATKVWTTGREAGIAQMEESFRKMRTDHVDLMQVHNLVDVWTHLR